MARETASNIGSGFYPSVYPVIPSGRGGSGPSDVGSILGGSNTTVTNPENIVAVPAWATSGVSVGSVPVKIWDANINYLLPTQRSFTVQNLGPSDCRIGPNSTSVIFPSGFTITALIDAATGKDATSKQALPIFKGAEVWASSNGTSQLQILVW